MPIRFAGDWSASLRTGNGQALAGIGNGQALAGMRGCGRSKLTWIVKFWRNCNGIDRFVRPHALRRLRVCELIGIRTIFGWRIEKRPPRIALESRSSSQPSEIASRKIDPSLNSQTLRACPPAEALQITNA